MKFKRCLFPIICTAVFFVLFLIVYGLFIFGTVRPLYLEGLMFLAPAAVIGIVTALACTGRISAIAANVTAAVLTPIFAAIMLFLFVFMVFYAAADSCEDPRYYVKAYNMFEEETLIAEVFPGKIPDGAEDVEFLYRPQFLQGGGEFSLKYTADDNDDIAEKLESIAVWSGPYLSLREWDEYPSYFGGESFFGEFDLPDDAVMYLIDFRNYHDESDFAYHYWNHGEYLIAALADDGTVLYRYEWW